MKTFPSLVAFALLAQSGLAQSPAVSPAVALASSALRDAAAPPQPTLIKIVQRYVSPEVPTESFAAQPKTYYIGGQTYSRIEEEFDIEQGAHNLIIVREPDIWFINYYTRHGEHITDKEPPFETHHNIMPTGTTGELARLEFGREQTFFREHQAARLEPQVVNGQMCERSELKIGNDRLVLNVRSDKQTPQQLDVFKDGKTAFSIRYDSYETGLPFDPALFDPPRAILISEPPAK